MITAEVQAATLVAAIRIATADIAEAAVDLGITLGVVTDGRHAVTDVTVPVAVETDRPAHQPRSCCSRKSGCWPFMWSITFSKCRLQQGQRPLAIRFLILVSTPLY